MKAYPHMSLKNSIGFSLIEALAVVSMIAILSAVAMPAIAQYVKARTFDGYSFQMEYLIKYAKMYAMERTTNVGICVSSGARLLTVRDIGPSRGSSICSGIAVKTMSITEDYITIAGSGASFDPRGLAIWNGYSCIWYKDRYSRVCIATASVRSESGPAAACSSCSAD